MLEIRHLVITVVSVFLALGLGILCGVGFSNPVQLETFATNIRTEIIGIQRQIDAKRQEIEQVRQDREDLQRVLERERKALRSLLPAIVDAMLADHRTAIIQTSGLSDFSFKDPMTQSLQRAGGTVSATVVIRPQLLKLEGGVLQGVLEALEVGPIAPEQAVPKICRQLTKLVLQGDPDNRLQALVAAEAIELSGDCQEAVDSLIVVGGADEESKEHTEAVDLPILTVCKELEMPCVATEPESVAVSFMGPYQTVAVSTVDNVDQLIGQISLVYALAGTAGHFGVKETAQSLLPAEAIEAAAG